MSRLHELATALGVSISSLFADAESPEVAIYRNGERALLHASQTVTLEALIPHTENHRLQAHIHIILLFKTFLDVNDTLGGPQGLRVPSMRLFGWDFATPIAIGEAEISFYMPYVVLCGMVLAATFSPTWAAFP